MIEIISLLGELIKFICRYVDGGLHRLLGCHAGSDWRTILNILNNRKNFKIHLVKEPYDMNFIWIISLSG